MPKRQHRPCQFSNTLFMLENVPMAAEIVDIHMAIYWRSRPICRAATPGPGMCASWKAVRRILLTGRYAGEEASAAGGEEEALGERLRAGELSADGLLGRYGALLYRQLGSHAEVSRCMGVDVRTARKYVESAKSG